MSILVILFGYLIGRYGRARIQFCNGQIIFQARKNFLFPISSWTFSHIPPFPNLFRCFVHHRHYVCIMRCILKKNLSSLCPSSSRLVSLSSPKNRFVPDIRRKAFIFVLSASLSSGTRFPIDTTMSGFSKALWDGSDKTGFDSLEHPGYTMESNPDDFTGGWLAYRKVWEQETGAEAEEQPSDCWVKDIIGDITKVDYQSMEIGRAPRILVLYGSLRPTSFSRKAGRLLVA